VGKLTGDLAPSIAARKRESRHLWARASTHLDIGPAALDFEHTQWPRGTRMKSQAAPLCKSIRRDYVEKFLANAVPPVGLRDTSPLMHDRSRVSWLQGCVRKRHASHHHKCSSICLLIPLLIELSTDCPNPMQRFPDPDPNTIPPTNAPCRKKQAIPPRTNAMLV